MTSARAITKYVRISPRKARLAADLIRGLPIAQATEGRTSPKKDIG
jgi:large subunit ribosomal protein L22